MNDLPRSVPLACQRLTPENCGAVAAGRCFQGAQVSTPFAAKLVNRGVDQEQNVGETMSPEAEAADLDVNAGAKHLSVNV